MLAESTHKLPPNLPTYIPSTLSNDDSSGGVVLILETSFAKHLIDLWETCQLSLMLGGTKRSLYLNRRVRSSAPSELRPASLAV